MELIDVFLFVAVKAFVSQVFVQVDVTLAVRTTCEFPDLRVLLNQALKAFDVFLELSFFDHLLRLQHLVEQLNSLQVVEDLSVGDFAPLSAYGSHQLHHFEAVASDPVLQFLFYRQ